MNKIAYEIKTNAFALWRLLFGAMPKVGEVYLLDDKDYFYKVTVSYVLGGFVYYTTEAAGSKVDSRMSTRLFKAVYVRVER